jgi:hypothetical protein
LGARKLETPGAKAGIDFGPSSARLKPSSGKKQMIPG